MKMRITDCRAIRISLNCSEIREEHLTMAAGLPAESQIEDHLSICASCIRHVEELRRVMALLDEWKVVEHLQK